MSHPEAADKTGRAIPWHFWVVGVLALLWYVSGAFTIQMAQSGKLPSLEPDEIAYYTAKPGWLVAITAFSTYGSVLASMLLLMRHRAAVWLYSVAFVLILVNDTAELLNGTSRASENSLAAAVTVIIALVAVAIALYSRAMQRRGILR